MNGGLKTTLDVLSSIKNDSATAALVPALDSPHEEISEGALRALLARRSASGGRELIRRWDKLNPKWQEIVAERPGRISGSVRDAILSPDSQLIINGCEVLLCIREYDLVPALINAAEKSSSEQTEMADQTLLRLCELLYEELAGPRDYNNRRDPQLVRKHVLSSLEQSVKRFDQHQNKDILEAFLMLVNRDSATLKRILQNPHDKSYLPIIEIMTKCPRLGVIRLVLNYLEDPDAPLSSLNVLAHRDDLEFVGRLLDKVGTDPSPQAKLNLKRIENFVWLRDDLHLLDVLDERQQEATVCLAKSSGMKRLEVFDSLRHLLTKGNIGGRKAACDALIDYKGAEANEMVMAAFDDPDPRVKASALSQLRDRGIPGALSKLLEAIESTHPQVREAAQQSLSEFNFRRFLAAFDMLDEEVRRTTGELVKKVDLTATDSLRSELSAASRTRRIRALKVAPAMDVVRGLEPIVVKMLGDSDHFVRTEAANALARCDTSTARQALRQALLDRSVMVQEAAESALQQLAPSARQASSPNSENQMNDTEIESIAMPPLPADTPPQQEEAK